MSDEKELWLYSDDEPEDIRHYGTPRHSGRYPWGSGKNPERSRDFLSRNDDLKKQGIPEIERAKELLGPDATTEDLRNRISITQESRKLAAVYECRKWNDKGVSYMEISRRTGIPASTVKEYLKEDAINKASKYTATADAIESEIKTKGYVQVGRGAEQLLGVTERQLTVANQILKDRGYTVTNVQIDQLRDGSGKTSVLVAAKKGSTYRDIVDNHLGDIRTVSDYVVQKDLRTGLEKSVKINDPVSIDGKRVYIRYAEDGGLERDGTIEVRRNVPDLSMGDSHYAQVRIGVDGTHYMKGMCTYSDDIPAGYDVIYNTNKSRGTPPEKVYKEMKTEKESKGNPFGALIARQNYYLDDDGNEKQGVLNVVREEGDWTHWSNSLPSQFLSKQSDALCKQQLDLAFKTSKVEFDEIKHLTNPVVKAELLSKFSDGCDASAVNLKAAALPKQGYHVLLPLTDLKDNEIYAPNYKDGEHVCLVRFPHGGVFEIPDLVVNNKRSKQAKDKMPNAPDAVGISQKTAEQLSGADFDGDTAIVIPNRDGRITTMDPLPQLKGYDPKSYKYPAGQEHPKVGETKAKGGDGFRRGLEMGKCTNLIMDMTLAGADWDEIAKATKYSMICTDAEKHDLNWKQAKSDFGIKELYTKYASNPQGGGTTVLSRASGEDITDKRGTSYIDPETGKKMYKLPKGAQWVNEKGELVTKKQRTTKMDNTDDARTLLSDNPTKKELMYADHANRYKALANEARKEILATKMPKKDPIAAQKYAPEVDSLKRKLVESKKASQYEKQALIMANEEFRTWCQDNPHADKTEQKKQKGKCMVWARNTLGYKRYRVDFTDKEWEAVQNNAVSPTLFKELLANADMDKVKKRALPKEPTTLSSTSKARIKAMATSGFTQEEIAEVLGISSTSVNKALKV